MNPDASILDSAAVCGIITTMEKDMKSIRISDKAYKILKQRCKEERRSIVAVIDMLLDAK